MTRFSREVGLVTAGMLALGSCAGSKEAVRDVQDITPGVAETTDGKVLEVDSEHDLISIRSSDSSSPNQPIWLNVGPNTVVEQGGQRVSLQELKPGDEIRASFDRRAGPEHATHITLLSPMSPSSSSSSPPAAFPAPPPASPPQSP